MSSAAFQPEKPFNSLPELPPRAQLETSAVLKACISARAALAALDTASELIPNAAILINTIPILEAQASSEIENIVTTTDRMFQFANEDATAADPATKEALRYRTALQRGYELLDTRPVSTNLAIELCGVLRGIDTEVRRVPGTTLRNSATREAVYTPPDGEARLRGLLANWETFLHTHDEIEPLIRMAAGHYQFEAIHPFEDGNGRTGRILNLLFLIERGLLRHPILYMSGAIIRTKNDYYRLLLEVTTRDGWEPWLLYMINVVENTSRTTTAKIRAIRELLRKATAFIRDKAPKIYSRELVDVIFEHPYARIGHLVSAGVAKRQTASEYLAKLTEIGVLQSTQIGRDKVFVHPALLSLLASETPEVQTYSAANEPKTS